MKILGFVFCVVFLRIIPWYITIKSQFPEYFCFQESKPCVRSGPNSHYFQSKGGWSWTQWYGFTYPLIRFCCSSTFSRVFLTESKDQKHGPKTRGFENQKLFLKKRKSCSFVFPGNRRLWGNFGGPSCFFSNIPKKKTENPTCSVCRTSTKSQHRLKKIMSATSTRKKIPSLGYFWCQKNNLLKLRGKTKPWFLKSRRRTVVSSLRSCRSWLAEGLGFGSGKAEKSVKSKK